MYNKVRKERETKTETVLFPAPLLAYPGRVCNKLINARLASNWRLRPRTLSSNGGSPGQRSGVAATAQQQRCEEGPCERANSKPQQSGWWWWDVAPLVSAGGDLINCTLFSRLECPCPRLSPLCVSQHGRRLCLFICYF